MKNPKVLVACEESQRVCTAFRERGIEAYSCDIQEPSGGHPEWHILGDAVNAMNAEWVTTMDGEIHEIYAWDLVIAHPPCTDIAVSGARWFEGKRKNGQQQASIKLFMAFANYAGRCAIENPIGIMSSLYRKPNQIIQPWMFGHGETKATCLWLNGLPDLVPTDIVSGREHRIWKMPPGNDRAKERSRTYHGIAAAMAKQWGDYLLSLKEE